MQTFRVSRFLKIGLFFLLGVALCAGNAAPQAPANELYILTLSPPGVSVVEDKQFKLQGSIPLPQKPSHGVLAPGGRYLYVLMNGALNLDFDLPKAASEVALVDLTERKVLKTIPLGWNASRMTLSGDGNYLLCFSPGRAAFKKNPREPAALTIVSTQTNEVTATLKPGRLGKEILTTQDVSRIFVLSRGEALDKKTKTGPVKAALTTFDASAESPLNVVEFDYEPAQMMLSKDQKWLYLMDRGNLSSKPNKHKNGSVTVVEVATGKVSGAHDAGAQPQQMLLDEQSEEVAVLAQAAAKDQTGKLMQIRGTEVTRRMDLGKTPLFLRKAGDRPGYYAFTNEELRFVPNQTSAEVASIPLNGKGVGAAGPEAKSLGGMPGETLELPQHERMAVAVRWSSKVALVNLKTNRVDRTVTTGRGGVKFGQFMGAMALSVAASAASYYAGYAMAQSMGSPYFYYNVYVFNPPTPNLSLAASADGKHLYALNTQTNDVTIIDVADGKVMGHVAVGGGARRIFSAPTGKLICAQANGQVTLIRTDTNERVTEFKPKKGKVHALQADASGEKILALTEDSLVVWDARTGEFLGETGGLPDPRMLIQPLAAKP